MNSINAFVAHSFDEEDAQLVRVFLDYLTNVSKLHPGFRWQHAEQAEPKHVAEKVLSLLDGKNLLIAICTKKEIVVQRSAFSLPWLFKKFTYISTENIAWKTSDWIIQEIGLAVGRNMDVILLVESGLKTPGELQGSLEFIQFDRDAPERSFDKLLQMVTALSGQATNLSVISDTEEVTSASEKPTDDIKPNNVHTEMPESDWTLENYRIALFYAYLPKNEERISLLNSRFINAKCSKEKNNLSLWLALNEYIPLVLDEGGSFKKLIEISDQNPGIHEISEHVAGVFRHLEEHGKAAIQFERAASIAEPLSEEIRLLGAAAMAYQSDGQSNAARAVMDKIRKMAAGDQTAEEQFLKIEKEFAEAIKEVNLQIAAMERMVELDPTDYSTRFSLAYKHSENENNVMAAWHYSRIPRDARSAVAANNLGVAYAGLNLPGMSVSSYRQAEAADETLAMSNLAHKFMQAGFFDEARALCDRASKIENYNKHIDSAKTSLADAIEREDELRRKKFDEAKNQTEFYRAFGRALLLPGRLDIDGEWIGPTGTITFTTAGNQVTAKGRYETPPSALFKNMGLRAEPTPMEITYVGNTYQGSIVCTVSRKEVNSTPARSLLAAVDTQVTALMAIHENLKEIIVLERNNSGAPEKYSFHRVRPAQSLEFTN